MRLCDLDEIKICVDRQYENCHGYSGSKKAIYREAILAVKSILHSAKSIDGVTVQEWISVEDRLPEYSNDGFADAVLVTDGFVQHMAYFVGGEWRFAESGEIKEPMWYRITHWMPLPQPPKGE